MLTYVINDLATGMIIYIFLSLYFNNKVTDGSFSYYSHNSMANWYTKTLGDTRFSLTMTDEDAARSYVEAYKQELL
ncbi:MAG: hypothetical protein ACLR7D_10310 [Lachnospira eligens]